MFHASENISNYNKSDDLYYEVERIVEKKIGYHGNIFYLIKWVGYSEKEMTWEPIENLSTVMDLVEQFELNTNVNQNVKSYTDNLSNIFNTFFEEDKLKSIRNYDSNKKYSDLDLNLPKNFCKGKKIKIFDIDKTKYIRDKKVLNGVKENSQKNSYEFKISKKRTYNQYNNNLGSKNIDDKYINVDSIKIVKTRRSAQDEIINDIEEYHKANIQSDTPSKIILAKLIEQKLYYWVEWEPRSDGTIADDALVSHDIMKEKFPLKLIEFYEQRLRYEGERMSILDGLFCKEKNLEDKNYKNSYEKNELHNIRIDSNHPIDGDCNSINTHSNTHSEDLMKIY